MNEADLVALLHDSMLLGLKLAGPLLAAGLVVGLLVSVLQAITQVHEATLAFIPKLLALGLTLTLLAPFMISALTSYAHELFNRIVMVGAS